MADYRERITKNGNWAVLGAEALGRDDERRLTDCLEAEFDGVDVAPPIWPKYSRGQGGAEPASVQNTAEIQSVVLKNMAEGVCATNEDDKVVYTNPAFDRMFGYDYGELRGRPLSILRDYSSKYQTRLDEKWAATLKVKGFWAGELVNRKKDGTRFATSVRISEINKAEKTFRIFVLTDSTQVRQAEALHMRLLQQLDAAQEAERGRFARELHDQMGQDLTALTLGLRSLERSIPANPEALTQLKQLQEIVHQLSRQAHNLAIDLRPLVLDDLGLPMALLTLLEQWSSRVGIKVRYHSYGLDQQRLPRPVETGIYRIVQEALTNIAKHARAGEVEVILEYRSQKLFAVIRDDGRGFNVAAAAARAIADQRLGLLGIKERVTLVGGTFEIQSAPDSGTTLTVSFPIPLRASY